mmetsp:Transcript_5073/g.14082  ORF Transcript_5073/g.14082 Transcript_5073/m.14082 type:complete len:210 (-) Transcript_5073:734-1363(-)
MVVLHKNAECEGCHGGGAFEGPRPRGAVHAAHRCGAWKHDPRLFAVPRRIDHRLLGSPETFQQRHATQRTSSEPHHSEHGRNVDDTSPTSKRSPSHCEHRGRPHVTKIIFHLQAGRFAVILLRQGNCARTLPGNEPGSLPDKIGGLAAQEVRLQRPEGVLLFLETLREVLKNLRKLGSKFTVGRCVEQQHEQRCTHLLLQRTVERFTPQ